MKYLVYGLSSILTSDAAATAVLQYAAELGRHALTDIVTLPAVGVVGERTTVTLVLGPGIPLLAEEAPDDELEPTDRTFVTDVTTRIQAVSAKTSGPT